MQRICQNSIKLTACKMSIDYTILYHTFFLAFSERMYDFRLLVAVLDTDWLTRRTASSDLLYLVMESILTAWQCVNIYATYNNRRLNDTRNECTPFIWGQPTLVQDLYSLEHDCQLHTPSALQELYWKMQSMTLDAVNDFGCLKRM